MHVCEICCASSRVGLTTSTRGARLPLLPRGRVLRMGSRNAAVLPVPVLAAAMRSRPSRTNGMACSCTGVGFS